MLATCCPHSFFHAIHFSYCKGGLNSISIRNTHIPLNKLGPTFMTAFDSCHGKIY